MQVKRKRLLFFSLRWQAAALVMFVSLAVAVFGWQQYVQLNQSFLQKMQRDTRQQLTHHLERAFQDSKEDLQELLSWFTFLSGQYAAEADWIKQALEGFWVNEDVVAIWKDKQGQLQLFYADSSAVMQDDTLLERVMSAQQDQVFCTQVDCFVLYWVQHQVTGEYGFIVLQRLGELFHKLREQLKYEKAFLFLQKGQAVPLATDIQNIRQLLTNQVVRQQIEAVKTGYVFVNQQHLLAMPLQLEQVRCPDKLRFWAIKNITEQYNFWQNLIKNNIFSLVLAALILFSALTLLITSWLKRLSVLQQALESAENSEFRSAADRLRVSRLFFMDELDRIFLMGRRFLLRLKRSTDHLNWLAYHDTLTGLPNRRSFYRHLALLVDGKKGAVIFIDLNRFKQINDVYGHHYGDLLLKQVSSTLQQLIRQNSAIKAYRLAGDEFTLLLFKPVSKATLQQQLQQLSSELKGVLQVGEQSVFYSASIGAVLLHDVEEAIDQDTLLHWADIAMYRAKHGSGEAYWYIFDPQKDDVRQRTKQELALVQWMREALHKKGVFQLVAQPIMALENGQISHYEVLLRLTGPQSTPVSPVEFIPIAECHGIIYDIDRWVLTQTLKVLRQTTGVVLSVNLSAPSLQRPNMGQEVVEMLKVHQVEPSTLIVELTETAYVEHMQQVQENLAIMKAAGIRLALDDFGVGFTSFQYLQVFAFDFVKLDGSYVRDMLEDSTHYAFVDGVTEIVHAYGLKAVAEFVENEQIFAALKGLRMNYAQGWYVGKPQPLETLPINTQ